MSYLKGPERRDGLPTIRNSGIFDNNFASTTSLRNGHAFTTLDDSAIHERGHDRSFRRVRGQSPPATSHIRSSSPSQVRRSTYELNDQVKMYKDELSKKDDLIAQLTRIGTVPAPPPTYNRVDNSKVDELLAALAGRAGISSTQHTEISSMQVKVESLTSQLRDRERELDSKDSHIRELKLEIEGFRDTDNKQVAVIQSLRDQLQQYNLQAGSLDTIAARGELAVSTLQRDLKDSQERVLELENRLRTHLEERERAEQDKGTYEKKFHDMVNQFSSIMRADEVTGFVPAQPEYLCKQLTDIVQENCTLKGKLLTLQDAFQNNEMETKASRETIMRLVSEVGREQKNQSRYDYAMDNLRAERDQAVTEKESLEKEVDLLKQRLDSSQRAWNSTRQELKEKEHHYYAWDKERKETELSSKTSQLEMKALKESLAALLSTAYNTVEPFEETIKDRIRQLMTGSKDTESHVEVLEGKIQSLTEQLENEFKLRKSEERRFRNVESEFSELQHRLRSTEGELATGEALREGLRTDKERTLRFMERVANAMQMDRIAADIGFDMSGDAIIARAEQLAKMEADALADRSTQVYSLQRKGKNMKQQLESKELHLDMLRKKIASLEERLVGKSEIESEKDSETMKVRKLKKLCEKYQAEIVESRQESERLKARLLESTTYKIATLEQSQEIGDLQEKIDQLERVRHKQAKKIAGLKDEVEYQDNFSSEKNNAASNTVHALSSELRTTKIALDEAQKRERQLLDLRMVIARMLGLEVSTLAVPDYEIIARLEKLIVASHSAEFATKTMESAMHDMEDGFRAGYYDSQRILDGVRTLRTTGGTRRTRPHVRTRSRSMSPARRRTDPRQY